MCACPPAIRVWLRKVLPKKMTEQFDQSMSRLKRRPSSQDPVVLYETHAKLDNKTPNARLSFIELDGNKSGSWSS